MDAWSRGDSIRSCLHSWSTVYSLPLPLSLSLSPPPLSLSRSSARALSLSHTHARTHVHTYSMGQTNLDGCNKLTCQLSPTSVVCQQAWCLKRRDALERQYLWPNVQGSRSSKACDRTNQSYVGIRRNVRGSLRVPCSRPQR
jgi:hypothetical protein